MYDCRPANNTDSYNPNAPEPVPIIPWDNISLKNTRVISGSTQSQSTSNSESRNLGKALEKEIIRKPTSDLELSSDGSASEPAETS